jgi:hypothetical protein
MLLALLAVLLMLWSAAEAASPYESAVPPTQATRIDELVLSRLQRLGIEPANVCSDAAFVRRVYLDVIGTLPTGKETWEFLQDQNPNKRAALIDRVLARPEFADYWAMKWSELLRVKAEFPINLWPNAVQAYHRWIHTSVKENMPYDKFVRTMLTANGSNFRVGQVNFYRAVQSKDPQGIAVAVALTFMGERAEKWPKERLDGMANFFTRVGYKSTSEWKEEIVFFDTVKTNAQGVVAQSATLPDGTVVKFSTGRDPREQFADWLVSPRNPHFTRVIANRVWSWLLGRGIIHEPDDIRPDNPPSNPELLAYLEKQLISSRYDVKHLFRLILNSQTYQFASIPKTKTPEAEANFAFYPLRRLEAEVLIDALNQITGTTEQYASPIPEPFTFIPDDQRSIALADGSITSSFLEQFGRPSRDTGLESERNSRPTADQRLHMLNSSHIQRKLENSQKLQGLTRSKGDKPVELISGLYLMILSRLPTEAELKTAMTYSQISAPVSSPSVSSKKSKAGGSKSPYVSLKGREALVDIAWALINSPEFQYRH